MTALKVTCLKDFCGRDLTIASVHINIDTRSYVYDYKLDEEGNLVLKFSCDYESPFRECAKFPFSERWVRSEMANDTNLMNQFDSFCTLLEKLYDVEVVLANESAKLELVDDDLLWEE